MAGIDQYRRSLRSVVRGLWSGVLISSQASNAFEAAIERRITQAWNEGAAECDIEADELSEAELIARDNFIETQIEFMPAFLADISANSKASGGKLKPQLTRVELWVNRYNEAVTQGKSLACADQKGQWFLGPTEEHCRSCNGFNGRVYRFSTWKANGAEPQSQNLACSGFNCLCEIKPTNKRVTPGKFPSRLLGKKEWQYQENEQMHKRPTQQIYRLLGIIQH
jgi:hypothetical protein